MFTHLYTEKRVQVHAAHMHVTFKIQHILVLCSTNEPLFYNYTVETLLFSFQFLTFSFQFLISNYKLLPPQKRLSRTFTLTNRPSPSIENRAHQTSSFPDQVRIQPLPGQLFHLPFQSVRQPFDVAIAVFQQFRQERQRFRHQIQVIFPDLVEAGLNGLNRMHSNSRGLVASVHQQPMVNGFAHHVVFDGRGELRHAGCNDVFHERFVLFGVQERGRIDQFRQRFHQQIKPTFGHKRHCGRK